MKKLISFSLFLGIILILIAARSVEAQVIVRARVVAPAPVALRMSPAYPMPLAFGSGYAFRRPYPGRVVVARPWHRHRPVLRLRVY